ncbi:MAG TPA: hypothetical protein PK530_05345 [Anaerolineales bacterium]|nr:hypothetical protein [Anaerolineales bacterium]
MKNTPDTNESPTLTRTNSLRVGCFISVGLLIFSVLCVSIILVVNGYATTSPRAGLPAVVCAGVSLNPKVQIGLSWQSMLSSYASPLTFSPLALCTHVPHAWLSSTLTRHSWEFLWPP